MKKNVTSWNSSNLFGSYSDGLPPVEDEADLVFDKEYDSDDLNASFDSCDEGWPAYREAYKWFEMTTSKQRRSTRLRTMIEGLEAKQNVPANLIFSGFYGLTANERVLIHNAMDMLVENSSRTVVACHLADSPFSDSAPLLKEHFSCYFTTKHLVRQVVSLHNLLTDRVGYIEFNDIRKKSKFDHITRHDNPLEKLHKLRHYTAEIRCKLGDSHRRKDLATLSAHRGDGGCDLRQWEQILSDNEPVYNGASAMPMYPNSCSPIISKNTVYVTNNLLNPIHTSCHRAFLIYRELAKLNGVNSIGPILYSLVLNEYEGVIKKKQPKKPKKNYTDDPTL